MGISCLFLKMNVNDVDVVTYLYSKIDYCTSEVQIMSRKPNFLKFWTSLVSLLISKGRNGKIFECQ